MQLWQSSPNLSWRRKYTKVLSGGTHIMKVKDQSKQMPAGKEEKELKKRIGIFYYNMLPSER